MGGAAVRPDSLCGRRDGAHAHFLPGFRISILSGVQPPKTVAPNSVSLDLGACVAVSFPPDIAAAVETTNGVGARGVRIAVVLVGIAFIDVYAGAVDGYSPWLRTGRGYASKPRLTLLQALAGCFENSCARTQTDGVCLECGGIARRRAIPIASLALVYRVSALISLSTFLRRHRVRDRPALVCARRLVRRFILHAINVLGACLQCETKHSAYKDLVHGWNSPGWW